MKVIILRERFCDTLVFSSEEKLLEYLKWFYPKAKHLRLKRSDWSNRLFAYNYNTPILTYLHDLEEIEVDEEIKKPTNVELTTNSFLFSERMEGIR